jgi:glycine betaine/proline transport system substrate-binding protein
MLWVYSPHWAPAKYKGEWVEFPEYTKECYTDPKWGSNPDAKYDCGKPHGDIFKYSWKGMKEKWPVAYNVAKNYKIDTDVLNKMSGEIDLDGKAPEDVAAEWIAANEATWKEWAK